MSQYNELRGNWTFPYKASEVLESIGKMIETQSGLYTDAWNEEKHLEHEIAAYRETLRVAGVVDFESALPPKETWTSRRQGFLQSKRKHAEKLSELLLLQNIMHHQCKLDPHRMFKLTPKDVQFFGLDK